MVDFKVELTSLVTRVMHFGRCERTFKNPLHKLGIFYICQDGLLMQDRVSIEDVGWLQLN